MSFFTVTVVGSVELLSFGFGRTFELFVKIRTFYLNLNNLIKVLLRQNQLPMSSSSIARTFTERLCIGRILSWGRVVLS